MSPPPDEYPDYEAHAVKAEQQAANAADARMAERWHRIAATYRHLSLYRLLQSRVSMLSPMSRRVASAEMTHLIEAAAKARSDIKGEPVERRTCESAGENGAC